MPTISKKHWIIFSGLAVLAALTWKIYTYPQLSFIDLSVDRPQAVSSAENYLTSAEVGLSKEQLAQFRKAAVFVSVNNADQYLQRSLGFEKEQEFFKKHNFELFFWNVRFFKENEKEEYKVVVSAATGEVTGYSHALPETAERTFISKEEAQVKAVAVLKEKFGFDPDQYQLRSNFARTLDKRTDYFFSWMKSDVSIPWSQEPDTGSAKLLVGATISGNETLQFFKNSLDIPETYSRYLDRMQNVGRNLSILFRIIFYCLLTAAIFYVVVQRNNLVMHSVKHFAIGLTAGIFFLYIATYFNQFESILYHYSTTTPMASYLWRNVITTLMDAFISVLGILMPILAGESLHYQVFSQNKSGSFLYYLRTTFLARNVGQRILLGYLVAVIMIGLQAGAFQIGQKYLGVWIEYSWMAQFSGSYLPFLAALALGVIASLSEEVCFRLFGITLGKKFLKNTALACLISSIIWGYGHSGYLVFPMWFRGLEVTILGLFLSYVYLRFGLLAVLTAHYLFDVFWGSSAYLLGHSTPYLFYSSLAILSLPLLLAAVAYLSNRKAEERVLRWKLNVHQLYNLEILREYIRHKLQANTSSPEELKHEIASHGWDIAVVEIAIKDITNNTKG